MANSKNKPLSKAQEIQGLRKSLEEVKNATQELPAGADVLEKIEQQASAVIRASLKEWENAYDEAKDPTIQDRGSLIEIYETIELDTHVSAIVETICNHISERDFQIVSGDTPDDKKTELFKQTWFDDFLSIVLDTTYWGYSGIQLGSVEDDKFTKIKSIPRQHIVPEKNSFRINPYQDDKLVKLDKEPYKTWVISLFPQLTSDQYKLGKYNKLAKMFILKRETAQFWAIYNELFGIPYRVIKTSIKDKARRGNAQIAMEKMQVAAWSVIDREDEIEFISTTGSSGNGFETFNSFINFANKEMSKALLGSTMVLEDGSSRSQSETHMKNTLSFINSRAKWAKNVINDQLIPRMIKLGFPLSEGDKFQWVDEDQLTALEWAEIFAKLGNQFDISPQVILDTIGIEVEEKQVEVEPKEVEPGNKSRANKIANFYQNMFK